MRTFCGVVVLTFGVVWSARAQLAVTRPTEKLLILAVPVDAPSDSAASVAAMDAAREKLAQQARYKVTVIPKNKICEALIQSGFPCDGLYPPLQTAQLARALGINSYTSGTISRADTLYVAKIHVTAGASGFASEFTVRAGSSPKDLGEAIADRLNDIVRAGEHARNCDEQLARNELDHAMSEARKAFEIEPNLTAAHLCVGRIYEVRHAPADSVIAAAKRALKGDPGNSTAWNRIASSEMVKGDTTGAMNAYDSLLAYNPNDLTLRKGLIQISLQHHDYDRAERLARGGLDLTPADQTLRELLRRTCVEGLRYACTLGLLKEEVEADSTKLVDTTELKLALADAQAVPDTQALLWWSRQAVAHYPKSVSFLKQLAQAFQMTDQTDSAVVYYKRVLAETPGDVGTGLLIAKSIIDNAVWDTAAANRLKSDTTALRRLREPFAAAIDSALPYLKPGFASPDSALRLFTINVAYQAGSKLASAGALNDAYTWLDQPYRLLANDTAAAHQGLRGGVAYLYGLSSTYTMPPLLKRLGDSKKCDGAPALNDRIQRAKEALTLGARVAPQQVRQPLSVITQFEKFMRQVKTSFKCRNF